MAYFEVCSSVGSIDMRKSAKTAIVVSANGKVPARFTDQGKETLELSPSQLLTAVKKLIQAGTRGHLL